MWTQWSGLKEEKKNIAELTTPTADNDNSFVLRS